MTDKTFRIATFAREHGIDAKRARASLRRAMKSNAKNVPLVVADDNSRTAHGFNDAWTFRVADRARVARIIMSDAQYAKFAKKAEKATPEPAPAE